MAGGPQSLFNRSFVWRFCVVTLLFGIFCWCKGLFHRTESDLFLFSSQFLLPSHVHGSHLQLLVRFDRPKSVCNRCVQSIGVVFVLLFCPCWLFCWYGYSCPDCKDIPIGNNCLRSYCSSTSKPYLVSIVFPMISTVTMSS